MPRNVTTVYLVCNVTIMAIVMFHSLLDKVTVKYTSDPYQLTHYEFSEGKMHRKLLLCFIFLILFYLRCLFFFFCFVLQCNSDIRELSEPENKSLISSFGQFCFGNTGSNLGPEKITFISRFILYPDLLYPGYTVVFFIVCFGFGFGCFFFGGGVIFDFLGRGDVF